MSRRCRAYAVLLLLPLASACATTPPVDSRTEEDAIRELDRRWNRELAAKNAGGVADLYADGGMLMAPNAPPAIGRAAIIAANTDMMRAENFSLTFEPTQITVSAAGDMAHDIGTYRFSMDMPGGRINDSGKYITLWKKVDGQWKIAADMFNTDMPMQPPVAAAPTATTTTSTAHGMVAPSDLKWMPSPASLPPGAKVAAMEGNPAEPGPFTMRVMLPDKYQIPPHWHPGVEHVTVISGTFHLGMGERFDASMGRALTAGSFSFMPTKTPHYAWATGETVVQLHGQGPWGVTYVNASDDPRKKQP